MIETKRFGTKPRVTTDTGLTLTTVTIFGRNAVKFGLIGLVVLVIGRAGLNAFVAYWKATHPPPPPPPTVGFGILPQINFTSVDEIQLPQSYQLETPNGRLPEFPDRAKVFLMIRSSPSLLADQNAKKLAATYGFVFQPEILNATTYRWNKSQPLLYTLELNINNNHFSLSSNYLSRSELLINKKLPSGFEAVSRVKNFLNSNGLLPSDVATSSGEIVYLKSLGGELAPAVSESDADYIQVDLNRSPIDSNYRMYTPGGYQGIISAIVAPNLSDQNAVVEISYNYNSIDYGQLHTYPLRPIENAWQLLQAGEGFVASNSLNTAVIRRVSMGYFDAFAEQDYLQPVYVFEGDGGFLGLVPALDPKYIQK